jgi:protein-S-isoprenylcysteine O-methyltransferase Ste14
MTIFIITWSLWFISEIALNRLFRSKNLDKKDLDKGSTRMIWRIVGIANTLTIIFAIFTKFQISHSSFIPYLGLFIIILGMLIRISSIIYLGRFFTVDVTIHGNHRIIQTGIYKFIRHPSYLGAIISFIGYGISLNNWFSLIIISIMFTGAMIYRINIEEKVLIKSFGIEYSNYMKKTYRLIPWLY